MIAPQITWPNDKAQLIDLIVTKAQAYKSGNPVLEQFVNANLDPLLQALPDNWTLTTTSNATSSSDQSPG